MTASRCSCVEGASELSIRSGRARIQGPAVPYAKLSATVGLQLR